MERISNLCGQVCQNNCTAAAPAPAPAKVRAELIENGKIGLITLNSPKDLNVLSAQLERELLVAIKTFNNSKEVKVIVIVSDTAKAFCAGADISRFPKLSLEDELISNNFQDFDNILFKVAKPLVCAVNGFCLGGGFELALACDVIFCSDDAKFGFPEIKLGLMPGLGGTQRFTKIAGKVRANQYILTGQTFDAQRAKEMNLIAEVVPKDKLREEVLKYAQNVSKHSLYSLITAKRTVNKAEDLGITEGLQYERYAFSTLFNLPGSKEGVTAFLQKRPPNFDKI